MTLKMWGETCVNMIRAGTTEVRSVFDLWRDSRMWLNCLVMYCKWQQLAFFNSLMHQQIKTMTCNSGV